MDLEAYVARHQRDWTRLEQLTTRRRRLTGAEIDELITLYQGVATQLSVLRSSRAADPVLVGRLSTLVARARSAVTGAHAPAWREFSRFFTDTFPGALYAARHWWLGVTCAFLAVAFVFGGWVAGSREAQSALAPPGAARQLVEEDFANYYSENPAAEFAFGVWTNNAWVAAACLLLGVFLGLPVIYILWSNAANVAGIGGLMVAHDRADVYFGLLLPHGLLELTAVFVAAGIGIRLGWTVIAPGQHRTRPVALASAGRTAAGIALGLVAVFAVSGLIEAYVTPSPLPTWARVGIGVLAELAFFAYVFVLGRRAVRVQGPEALRAARIAT